jgi:hypothetical protein
MWLGTSEIRGQAATADILEWAPFFRCSGGLVEIHRNMEPAPDLLAGLTSDPGALLECDAADGDEGHYIGRADPGVDALMP